MTYRVTAILLAGMMIASGSAFAEGDPEAGKSQAAVCAACHGTTGTGLNELWPNLAGQGYSYIVKQVTAFRDGTRQDPLMSPMAQALSDQAIEDLAAYFSSQPAAPAASGTAAGDAAAGEHVSAFCVSCHGTGASPNDVWPNLAGQSYAYLLKQLNAFNAGTREDEQMLRVVKSLTEDDIRNVAAFYSQVVPSSPTSMAETRLAELPAPEIVAEHAPIIATPEFVTPRAQPTRKYWADFLPEGHGRDIVIGKCQGCHDSQRTIAFARTKEEWLNINQSMIRRGTPLLPDELTDLTDYFTEYFGFDSTPIPGYGGEPEVGMKPCKPEEWPKGSSDFRERWVTDTNLWLSNQQGTNVDVFDPVSKKLISRIECISAPDRPEFSRDGNTAYIPSRVEHNITVVDTRTGAILKKVPLLARPNTPVISRDYKKVYVAINPVRADEAERGYVQVFDTETLEITKNIETQGGIHYARLSPDGKLLLALGNQNYFLNVYDTSTDELLYTCCEGTEVGDVVIEAGPDGTSTRLLAGFAGTSGITALDARTGEVLTRVDYPVCDIDGPTKGEKHAPATSRSYGFHGGEISPDGKVLWVMQGSFVYKYSVPGLEYLGHVHLAQIDPMGRPYTPAVEGARLTVSADGKEVYAIRPGRSLLSFINAETMQEEALVPTGRYPLHMNVWPRGSAP